MYYVDEDEDIEPVKHPSKHQYTNNELATMIDRLTKDMNDGFNRINIRMDRFEARLDYIVTANNLKDLSNNNKK